MVPGLKTLLVNFTLRTIPKIIRTKPIFVVGEGAKGRNAEDNCWWSRHGRVLWPTDHIRWKFDQGWCYYFPHRYSEWSLIHSFSVAGNNLLLHLSPDCSEARNGFKTSVSAGSNRNHRHSVNNASGQCNYMQRGKLFLCLVRYNSFSRLSLCIQRQHELQLDSANTFRQLCTKFNFHWFSSRDFLRLPYIFLKARQAIHLHWHLWQVIRKGFCWSHQHSSFSSSL